MNLVEGPRIAKLKRLEAERDRCRAELTNNCLIVKDAFRPDTIIAAARENPGTAAAIAAGAGFILARIPGALPVGRVAGLALTPLIRAAAAQLFAGALFPGDAPPDTTADRRAPGAPDPRTGDESP